MTENTGAEATAILPETAAQLVELERLQRSLADAEERAKSHWEQYLRALAELDNVRKRAARDIEAANRYGLEKFAAELLPVKDTLDAATAQVLPRARRRPCSSCPGRSSGSG